MQATLLAGRILAYASNWKGGTFDSKDFEFKIQQGKWLLRKSIIRSAIEKVMALDAGDRVSLNKAFLNDITFHQRLNDSTFRFQFPRLPTQCRLVGKELLNGFYNNILGGSGFTRLPGQREILTRHTFEKAYREANPGCHRICPACLEDLPIPFKGRSLVDREHFMPKEMYPPLSVHPWNLTLVCIICNERVHVDADPLALDVDSATSGLDNELRTSFFPYLRPGLEEIELTFDLACEGRYVFLIAKDGSEDVRTRIENFDRVYGISFRWSEILVCLHEDLINYFRVSCVPLNEKAVEAALARRIETARLGAQSLPRKYLEWQYLSWLRRDRLRQVMYELKNP